MNAGSRDHSLKPQLRIGQGYDSHEFKPGIPLLIGGVKLAHDKGLGGHSDGDVLLHAITDALLGAIAGPDIGSLFPPSDPQWKGADSAVFLARGSQASRERRLCAGQSRFDADFKLAPKSARTPARFANESPNCAAFPKIALA